MIAGNKNPKDNILLANFHTHTFRCHHAVGQDREYVEKAIEQGIKTLGFSDHSPYFLTATTILTSVCVRKSLTDM